MLLISINEYHRKRLTSISFNKFNKERIRPVERSTVSRTWWYAAAAMVVLGVGISFYAVNHYQAVEESQARIAQIKPGSKQAVLTLPDGSTY